MPTHEVFAYLRVHDAASAIDWYRRVFGARERLRLVEPGTGRVGHAEIVFDEAGTVMIADEHPELGSVGPRTLGGTSVGLHLHVHDADAICARAVEAGAAWVRPIADRFFGERSGTIRDPFGHEWNIGHDLEEVSPEEMQRRYEALFET